MIGKVQSTMRRILLLFCLVWSVMSCDAQTMYTRTNCTLYDGPATWYKPRAQLKAGSEVKLLKKQNEEWVLVSANRSIGYLKTSLITSQPPHRGESTKKQIVTKHAKGLVLVDSLTNVMLSIPQEEASFPGGNRQFYKWLGERIHYPQTSKNAGVEGVVVARFTINQEGEIGNINIIAAPNDELAEEVLRVLYSMPKWTPACNLGEYVPSVVSIPVLFCLDSSL